MKWVPMRSNPAHIRSLVPASLLAASGLVPVLSQPAPAASTFTVNSTADTSDGSCNSSPNCTLREAIQGGNSTVSKLVIEGFSDRGIFLEGVGGDVVRGCYIGLDAAGTTASANHIGILWWRASGTTRSEGRPSPTAT